MSADTPTTERFLAAAQMLHITAERAAEALQQGNYHAYRDYQNLAIKQFAELARAYRGFNRRLEDVGELAAEDALAVWTRSQWASRGE